MEWTNISIKVDSDNVDLWINCYHQDKQPNLEAYDMVDFRETYVAIGYSGMSSSARNFAVSFIFHSFGSIKIKLLKLD